MSTEARRSLGQLVVDLNDLPDDLDVAMGDTRSRDDCYFAALAIAADAIDEGSRYASRLTALEHALRAALDALDGDQ